MLEKGSERNPAHRIAGAGQRWAARVLINGRKAAPLICCLSASDPVWTTFRHLPFSHPPSGTRISSCYALPARSGGSAQSQSPRTERRPSIAKRDPVIRASSTAASLRRVGVGPFTAMKLHSDLYIRDESADKGKADPLAEIIGITAKKAGYR